MKVLIVENDPLIAFDLNDMLMELEYPESPVVDNVDTALELIEKGTFDVVLIDIELEGDKDGIELGEILNEKGVPFIYLTGLRQRPVFDKAQKTNPLDNLAKPVHVWQLRNSLAKVFANKPVDIEFVNEAIPSYIAVTKINSKTKIKIEKTEIIYLVADGNNCEIHTSEKRYVSSTPMNNVLDKINSPHFVRISRKNAVNVDKVISYDGNLIYLEGTEVVMEMKETFRKGFLKYFNVV